MSSEGLWSTALFFREQRGTNWVLGNICAFLLSKRDFHLGMSLVCFTVAKNARGIAADRLIWRPPKLLPVLRVCCKCADRCSVVSKTERREADKVISTRGNNALWGGGMSGQERAVPLLLKQMRAPAHPGHGI